MATPNQKARFRPKLLIPPRIADAKKSMSAARARPAQYRFAFNRANTLTAVKRTVTNNERSEKCIGEGQSTKYEVQSTKGTIGTITANLSNGGGPTRRPGRRWPTKTLPAGA